MHIRVHEYNQHHSDELLYRPFLVLPSDGPRYHAIFKDDSVGPFVARHHIDADEYQREFDRNLAAGRMPIAVRAAGRVL